MDLIDETSRVLDTVVGLNLSERRWAAVGAAMNRVDDAVHADDTKELRAALKRLRETAAGLVPSLIALTSFLPIYQANGAQS